MPRLKDRNKQTPGGHKFYDPVLKYRSRPWSSVDQIAEGLIQARLGNPALTQKHGWSTDVNTVRNEIDEAIARQCLQMGWRQYVFDDTGGGAVSTNFPQERFNPKNQRFLGKMRSVVAGAEINIEWLASGEKAVPIQHAEKRAEVCVGCEYNGKGGLLSYFTVPASSAIKKAIEKRDGMKLKTSHDEKINICEVCLCPIKLKIFSPISLILEKMPDEIKEKLPEHCWILRESLTEVE